MKNTFYMSKIWQGGGFLLKGCDTKKHINILNYGIEHGLNVIDTAESYGDGESERIIGQSISNFNRSDIVISTKVSAKNLAFLDVIKSCENSLKRLNTDYIDIYHIHWYNANIPLNDTVKALKSLQDAGKIKYIGIGNFTYNQILEIYKLLDKNLTCIQMEYNLINRIIEDKILPFCNENNIILGAYTPMNIGSLNIKNTILQELSLKYNKKIYQIILAWILYNKNINAIIKSWNLNHIDDNIDAANIQLEKNDYELISNAFKSKIIKLYPNEIQHDTVSGSEMGILNAYKTIEDALKNKLNFYPSPLELSKEIKHTKLLSKPIYIKYINGIPTLSGGSVRYWAWVLAFGFNEQIECIII